MLLRNSNQANITIQYLNLLWVGFFAFFFNAQRKHGGKFKYLDRYCDYFSSFVKIRDYITTERKGKMILMAPFLSFLPFFCSCLSALPPLPPPPPPGTQLGTGTSPTSMGLGLLLEAQALSGPWGRRGLLSTLPRSSCHSSAALLTRARGQGTHEQSQLGQLQTPAHLQKPHPECPSPSLAVCHLLRETHLSFDLKLCLKVVPGIEWYLSDSPGFHIIATCVMWKELFDQIGKISS